MTNDITEASTSICPAPDWYAIYTERPEGPMNCDTFYTDEAEEIYRVPLCCWQVGAGAGLVFGMIAAPTPMQAEQFAGFVGYKKA